MKAKHLFYTLFIFLFSLTSCENEANIDYVPTVLFNFEGGTNLVTTPKGIKEYTVKGSITSTAGLTSFVISTANAETGAAISVIESTRQTFDEPKSNYDFSYTITNLSENKAIKISVTDAEGEDFQKISGITSKNGRNDAKRLNIRVVTVSNDDKPKNRKTQRKADLRRRMVCKSLPVKE